MRMLRSTLSIILCCSLAALISSCATFRNRPRAIAETVKQAQSQVALGDYQKALALYAAADDKYGHDAALQHHFVRTGDRIRSAADMAFQQGVFSQAGGIYHILLESGITGRHFQEPLSFDTAYLRGRIGSCSKALMELGLVKYREDDLEGACAIWNKVLAFDPGNKAVTKALRTTGKQRKRLKSISATAK
jgi:tetratricopeptide (TPR) repeat protein